MSVMVWTASARYYLILYFSLLYIIPIFLIEISFILRFSNSPILLPPPHFVICFFVYFKLWLLVFVIACFFFVEFQIIQFVISFVLRTLEWWDAVLQKRLAWALFVLLLSTLVCCQPTELILGFLFHKFPYPPPLSAPLQSIGSPILLTIQPFWLTQICLVVSASTRTCHSNRSRSVNLLWVWG